MSKIRYKYAYDENGEYINIESVSPENRHERHFHCVSCGEELIPRLGKVRTHHFAHKVADVSCNKETYLHKIGKWLLKSKFDESESFVIEYRRKVKCKNCDSCPFYKEDECIKDEYEGFDLKKYYDTCTEEQQVGGYVADLLLTNSEKEKRKPVLIEIRVSHECTEEKKESGDRIIEIRVKSEDDLLRIVDSNIIREQEDRIKFIGFSRDSKERKILGSRVLFRFALMKSGAAFVSNYEDMPTCNDNERMFPNSILELNIEPDRTDYIVGGGDVNVYDYGLAIAIRKGYDLKNCILCRYRRTGMDAPSFCCMSSKYGTPMYPKQSDANRCQYYRFDKPKFDRILQEFSDIPFSVVE